MTDRPILFSAPMVRALLDGHKTQTRRILKLPTKGEYVRSDMGGWEASVIGGTGVTDSKGNPVPQQPCVWNQTTGTCISPDYAISDRLWVKETWRTWNDFDQVKPSNLLNFSDSPKIFYEADRDNCGRNGKTRVSIHMPRWASRLLLTVTDVRVERLQDISEADAMAEGIFPTRSPNANGDGWVWDNLRDGFHNLWDNINGDRNDASWEANPWVVAVSFNVENRNIDQ